MNQLVIPNKLYGREQSVAALLDSFEHISSGHSMVLLVPGSSGTGKTALVHELQLPINNRNGFFISGKFDQYQQNIPYFAFRQALTELCRELLSWDILQRTRIKNEILQAIGNLGQVLIELVPELELFLGSQPALIGISAQEARHRFIDVFCKFLTAVCQPEHPLTLFIDDWQWADDASFDLLKQIQTGISLRYLLIIVSYRDNEIDASHPLTFTLNYLHRQAMPVQTLEVKNISYADVLAMLIDTLKPAPPNLPNLARLIQDKTQGNPFFVKSFLSFLYDANLLWFDSSSNCWQIRLDQIGGSDLLDNVVDLFVLKFRRLEMESQNLFSLAACLGNRFDLNILSLISGRNLSQCQAVLFSDQSTEILLPLVEDNNSGAKECMFVHDRLQQAARSLIEPVELPRILLKIGRLLLNNLRSEQLSERLFEVVNNLNSGYLLIQDINEKLKLFELNIRAGRKAYKATAYRAALQYYRSAARLLEKPDLAEQLWLNQHELCLSLCNELGECEFLEGDRGIAEQWIRKAAQHSKTAVEKANALSVLITQYTLQAKYPEAIAVGKEALAALDISLPVSAYELVRNSEIGQIRQKLEQRTVASLADLPAMRNPHILMAAKILITMGPPCYRAHQQLWSVIVPKVVNLTIDYGNIPQIGYSHPAFGGLLGWVDNDYATAKEFAELATALMTDKFQSPSEQSVFYLMIGSSIRHWFKHLKYSSQDYQNAVEIGLQAGNMQYAAYAFGHNMYCQFYQGIPLASLIQQTQQSMIFSQTRLNQWAIDLLEGGLHIFGTLADENLLSNQESVWTEADYLHRVTAHHNIQVTCIYKVIKTFALLIGNDYEAGLALSDETERLIFTVGTQGLLPWPEYVFTRLLLLTALYPNAERKQQGVWRAELEALLKKLAIWADNCAENFAHKYLLAQAELARIDAEPIAAAELYDQAIASAQAANFLHCEALANECAYHFWLELKNERLVYAYWRQAYICYERWGALNKTAALEAEFLTYLNNNLPDADKSDAKLTQRVHDIKKGLLQNQIQQLHRYTLQLEQMLLKKESAQQAEELAHAMQRLRTEIAERKRIEQYEQFRSHVLEQIAGSQSVSNILHSIALGLEQFNPAMLCSILLLDDDGKHLYQGAAPSLPDFYNAAIDGLEIGDGVGSCGTAAFSGERIIVADIAEHPYWAKYKELAAQASLRACWSQPIYSSTHHILGTFAVYHHDPHAPTDADIYIIEQFSRLASIAIEQKRMEDKVQQLAFYDSLTELPNRRLLEDRLYRAFDASQRSGHKGALLFIDMDNFKTLNDTLGHDKGDLLLQQVAERLKSCVRKNDTVARLGGDEFVVMLEELSQEPLEAAIQAETIGEKILVSLNRPYQLLTHEYHSTPSIGVTLFNNHEQSIENLLRQADIAMYQVKAKGRNALCFFDPQMQIEINAHAALEADLRQALAQNQFQLYYQPQFFYDHKLVGAEVLLRWQHPKRGFVSPTEFIPIAEESGLILQIGNWVLEHACLQKKLWETAAHTQHLQMAVNISTRQFRQHDFVAQIEQLLERMAVNPAQIKLELTESLMMDNTEDSIVKINALRKLGLRFSLDDFGTGYSSLSYLTKLPLDQIKIDQSFVRNLGVKSTDAVIVQTIIGMAKNLGMEIIAEGVEKAEQCEFLKQHDCLIFQGYFFSKPLPIEQFEQIIGSCA